MSSSYAGVAGNIGPNAITPPVVTVPSDGDSDNAATFAALQALTDQSAFYLKTIQLMALANLTQGSAAGGAANDFAWNGTTYVAALATGTTTHWATSPDAKTWTAITSGASQLPNSVIWVPSLSLFVGVCNNAGLYSIETSPAGGTWTARTVPDTTATNSMQGNCIAFGASLLVAAGNTGHVTSSSDGITWTSRGATQMAGKAMAAVVFGGGQFVAVSYDCFVFTSPDGLTWTARGQIASATNLVTGVAYNPRSGLFMVGAFVFATSPDGITWTTKTGPSGGGSMARLAFAWGYFLVLETISSSIYIYGSADNGATWAQLAFVTAASSMQGLKLVNDRVIVGLSGAAQGPFVSLAVPGL